MRVQSVDFMRRSFKFERFFFQFQNANAKWQLTNSIEMGVDQFFFWIFNLIANDHLFRSYISWDMWSNYWLLLFTVQSSILLDELTQLQLFSEKCSVSMHGLQFFLIDEKLKSTAKYQPRTILSQFNRIRKLARIAIN